MVVFSWLPCSGCCLQFYTKCQSVWQNRSYSQIRCSETSHSLRENTRGMNCHWQLIVSKWSSLSFIYCRVVLYCTGVPMVQSLSAFPIKIYIPSICTKVLTSCARSSIRYSNINQGIKRGTFCVSTFQQCLWPLPLLDLVSTLCTTPKEQCDLLPPGKKRKRNQPGFKPWRGQTIQKNHEQ